MASAVQGLGPRRRRNVIWGYVLAAATTIMLVLMVVGAFASMFEGPESDFAAGFFYKFFALAPAAIGLGVAGSACESHLPNSMAVWGAIIWNALLITAFLALMVFGIASS
jgi:hypothetical protein